MLFKSLFASLIDDNDDDDGDDNDNLDDDDNVCNDDDDNNERKRGEATCSVTGFTFPWERWPTEQAPT